MQFKGAVIEKDHLVFAIVYAAFEDLRSEESRLTYLESCQPHFPDLPIILAGEDSEDNPIYFGDSRLIQWLETQPTITIQWETFDI